MADQFSSAPFIYPQGSFYQGLDARIKSLEDILGTGVGQLPDGIVSEFKLADSAVTARSVKNNSLTGNKLAADALAVATVASTTASTVNDADFLHASASSKSVKFSLTTLIASIFKTTRKIGNANFLDTFRVWNSSDPTKGAGIASASVSPGVVRYINMPDRDVMLGNVKQDKEVFRVAAAPAYSARQIYTHGRATAPSRVEYRLICTAGGTANAMGFATGDVVYPETLKYDGNGSQWNVFTYSRLSGKTFEYQVYTGYLMLNISANTWVGLTAAHAAAWDVEFTLFWD